jgi:hypothetical protein
MCELEPGLNALNLRSMDACGALVLLATASCSGGDGARCRTLTEAAGRQIAEQALQELIRENQQHDTDPSAYTLHDVVAGIDVNKLQPLMRRTGGDARLYRFSAQATESNHHFSVRVSDKCETEFFFDS